MSLKGIISIAKMPGLYKVIAQTKSGFIVESIPDKKRMPVSSTQRISMLEEISMYCKSGDTPLLTVFQNMKNNDAIQQLDARADIDKLKAAFETVLPDYDADRVYNSDIQKVVKWYQLLKDEVSFEAETTNDDNAESTEGTKVRKADEVVHNKAVASHAPKVNSDKKVVATKTRKKV
jgi:hypothetical protein